MIIYRNSSVIFGCSIAMIGCFLLSCQYVDDGSATNEEGIKETRNTEEELVIGEWDVEEGDESIPMPGCESAMNANAKFDGRAVPVQVQAMVGEWRDLDNWSLWKDLMKEDAWACIVNTWGILPPHRATLVVMDGDAPVVDAHIKLSTGNVVLWEARTGNGGEAELFWHTFTNDSHQPSLVVSTANNSITVDVSEMEDGDKIGVQLPSSAPSQVLDLLLLVDTTGSMGDELAYLQSELTYVVEAVMASRQEDLIIRTSVNFYRDEGDDYVVESFPFTDNVDDASEILGRQGASGGGDQPEAVHSGLAEAINAHEWSESAASRLLFIVLDAPPHRTEKVILQMQELTGDAAAKGIRIMPITAVGTTRELEFVARSMAIATGGTYTFMLSHNDLTGQSVPMTLGNFIPEPLNDLMTRMIILSL